MTDTLFAIDRPSTVSMCGADDVELDRRSVMGRADAIIGAFDESKQVLSLNELAQVTGLPKSTVHRFAEQLRQMGWLERVVDGYRIGMRMFELGGLATRRSSLCEGSYPVMMALARRTGLAVQLAILEGPEIIYIERIRTGQFRLPTRDGGRMPAYCTALGKSMLALDAEAEEEAIGQPMKQRTANTICTPESLSRELERIRERGIAFDNQEAYRGLACVAAPVRNQGKAIAAISVTGPAQQIDLPGIAPSVVRAAELIWQARFNHRRAS